MLKYDEYFMKKALCLAEKGRGFVSPNPLVGAVIVRNSEIIGNGYHKKFGDAHAEINALKNAKESVKGATLYVTLEPCNYWGKKTPPCVPEIINSGIKKVVIGVLDCNPKVCNKGVRDLENAGIIIKVGVLKKDIEKQNESYIKYVNTGLPFVILKLGLTLDGRIATKKGESKWITSPQSRMFDQKLRKGVDAILAGINTVLKDNPKLTCRIEPKKQLTRVILDPKLQTPINANVMKGKCKTIIFTARNKKSNFKGVDPAPFYKMSGDKTISFECDITQPDKRGGVEIVKVKSEKNGILSWDEILKELAKRQIASVLIEGGAQVASSALQANIVDKLYLIYAPKILGQGISFSDYLKLNGLKSAIRFKDYKIFNCGKDFILEAYVQRNN